MKGKLSTPPNPQEQLHKAKCLTLRRSELDLSPEECEFINNLLEIFGVPRLASSSKK